MVATISPQSEGEAELWLRDRGLLTGREDEGTITHQFSALSKCKFGTAVSEEAKVGFLWRLVPCWCNLAAKQNNIGNVKDPKYHYRLRLNNLSPISSKPMRLKPHEEAWLDVHLDELLAKNVIGPILPHE